MTVALRIKDGERSWSIDLTETKITLGRHPHENQIVLNDKTVSRIHARLEKKAGGYQIVDCDSLNKVAINGEFIPPNQPYPLRHGDRVELGAVELTYELTNPLADRIVTSEQKPQPPLLDAAAKPLDTGRYDKVWSLVQSASDGKLEEWRVGPFHIFCSERSDQWLGEIRRTLKRAYHRMGEKLGYYPETVRVEVYPTRSQLIQVGQQEGKQYPEWAAALYDGENGVIRIETSEGSGLPTREELYIIVTHEYVHLVTDAKTGRRCPYWLNEGIAQTEAEDFMPVLRRLAKHSLIPLRDLEGPFDGFPNKEQIRLAYDESHAAVEWLVEQYKWDGIRRLLDALAARSSIEAGLGTLGLDYQALEAGWRRWVAERLKREL